MDFSLDLQLDAMSLLSAWNTRHSDLAAREKRGRGRPKYGEVEVFLDGLLSEWLTHFDGRFTTTRKVKGRKYAGAGGRTVEFLHACCRELVVALHGGQVVFRGGQDIATKLAEAIPWSLEALEQRVRRSGWQKIIDRLAAAIEGR